MFATPIRGKPSSAAQPRISASRAVVSKEGVGLGALTRKGYAVAPYNGQPAEPESMPQAEKSEVQFALPDARATEELGAALARAFPGAPSGPAGMHLTGDLGAGK